MREANFLTDKSQLVTIPLPIGTAIVSNSLKFFFSSSNTNSLKGKLINRIKIIGFIQPNLSYQELSAVNGVTAIGLAPNPTVFLTLKDNKNNVLMENMNVYDLSQQCNNTDVTGRRIVAPVRRFNAIVNWENSYITITTSAPYTVTIPTVLAMQVSYTNPN